MNYLFRQNLNKAIRQALVALGAAAVLCSCDHSGRTADTRGIDLQMHIGRFDSAVWTLDRTSLPCALDTLVAHYPDIAPVWFERVVEFGAPTDTATIYTLRRFYDNAEVCKLYTDALAHFADLGSAESQLTEAFKRARYFFPDKATPRLYAHVSGLNQSMVLGDGFVSASIDNYLGCDYPLYERVGIYGYLRQNMRPEKLVPDYVTAWLLGEYPFIPRTGEIQEEMIYRGKILYTVSVLLPHTPDSLLIGYTAEQWEWCRKYEHDMWMTLVGSRDLFSRDATLRAKYLNDAPFTKPFTQQSPGRAGAFVGWQIVKKYMQTHRDVSPLQLMLFPEDEIMREAKYNP